MTVLSATKRAELEARKAQLEDLLDEAYATYENVVKSTSKNYRFDSGEGSQAVTKSSLKELTHNIEWLEKQIDYLDRRLNGKLVVNLNVRHKQGLGYWRRYGWR